MIPWWIDSPRDTREERRDLGLGWEGRLTPKRCLGRSEILWVVSASIFLLVARCLSHEAEPHTIGSNGFRKRTHAAYGLGGAIRHSSGEGWIWAEVFSAGALLFPLAFIFYLARRDIRSAL